MKIKLPPEDTFALFLLDEKIKAERHYLFSNFIKKGEPKYKCHFDFVLLPYRLKLAVEIEGGTWKYGRHNRPQGYADDCVKYNLAILHGWRVLRYTTDHVNSGYAIINLKGFLWHEEKKQA